MATTKKIPEGMHDVKEYTVKAHMAKDPDDHNPATVEGEHKVKAHKVAEHLAANPGHAAEVKKEEAKATKAAAKPAPAKAESKPAAKAAPAKAEAKPAITKIPAGEHDVKEHMAKNPSGKGKHDVVEHLAHNPVRNKEEESKKAPAKAESKPATKAEAKAPAKTATPAKADKKEKSADKPKGVPYVSNGQITVTLIKSPHGCVLRQIRTVQALGLKNINDSHVHKDNPAIRGMCNLVAHLVKVEKI